MFGNARARFVGEVGESHTPTREIMAFVDCAGRNLVTQLRRAALYTFLRSFNVICDGDMIPFSLKAHPLLKDGQGGTLKPSCRRLRDSPCHAITSVGVKEIWKRQISVCKSSQRGHDIDAHQM